MVQVAAAVEIITGIVGTGRLDLPGSIGKLVIAADSLRTDMPGLAVPLFCREVGPVCYSVTVVDDHVGDKAHAFLLVGVDHVAQLGLRAERRVVIGEPVLRHISHVLVAVGSATSAVGNPD